jgi:hypothetical protein
VVPAPEALFNPCNVSPFVLKQGRQSIRGDRKGLDGRDHGQKGISRELVTVINDGLYYYEQVWESLLSCTSSISFCGLLFLSMPRFFIWLAMSFDF